MKLYNYRKANTYEFYEALKKTGVINNRAGDYSAFEAALEKTGIEPMVLDETSGQKAEMRWSLPFFAITWFVLFCGLPFRWMIKGEWGYESQSKVMKFVDGWMKRLKL